MHGDRRKHEDGPIILFIDKPREDTSTHQGTAFVSGENMDVTRRGFCQLLAHQLTNQRSLGCPFGSGERGLEQVNNRLFSASRRV